MWITCNSDFCSWKSELNCNIVWIYYFNRSVTGDLKILNWWVFLQFNLCYYFTLWSVYLFLLKSVKPKVLTVEIMHKVFTFVVEWLLHLSNCLCYASLRIYFNCLFLSIYKRHQKSFFVMCEIDQRSLAVFQIVFFLCIYV